MRPTAVVTIFYIAIACTPVSSLAPEYKEISLTQLCDGRSSKQSLYLHNQEPHIFKYNNTNRKAIHCHLELHLKSQEFGFSVFIQSLNIDPDCNKDFLQFGRDFLIITSKKSDQKCGIITPYDDNSPANSKIRMVDIKNREWIETEDDEMDVWFSLSPTQPNSGPKELSLIVTPFRKRCRTDDQYYRKCPGSDRCIKRELFCDGFVNCDGHPKDEQEEYCLVNPSIGGNVDMFLSIPIIILIVIFALLGVMFVIFMIRLFYVSMKTKRTNSSPDAEAERRALRDSSVSTSPSRSSRSPVSTEMSPTAPQAVAPPANLPPHPPTYVEVMGGDYKDDPPKYSEVPEDSHSVIYKS